MVASDVITIFEIVGALLGVLGAAFMAYERNALAAMVWLGSNSLLIAVALSKDAPYLALMYSVYGLLAMLTLWNRHQKMKRSQHVVLSWRQPSG